MSLPWRLKVLLLGRYCKRRAALQALLQPFSAALAATKGPALAARLRDGVFGELAQAAGGGAAFAALDAGALAADLFALGADPSAPASPNLFVSCLVRRACTPVLFDVFALCACFTIFYLLSVRKWQVPAQIGMTL